MDKDFQKYPDIAAAYATEAEIPEFKRVGPMPTQLMLSRTA